MEKSETICPNCGFKYYSELTPEINKGCPKCMADFLMNETETMSSEDHEKFIARLKAGDRIHDMEIISFIGKGGMGYVYKARQQQLNRIVAVKILDPSLASSGEFTSRFTREAKALASLNHPNIVQIYDYGKEEDYYFLVMEFIDGATLRQILNTEKVAPEAALRYVPQICNALEYAHSQGVIHRDIKPENILIDKMGNLKIADFGLAKLSSNESVNKTYQTRTGDVMGTPHYMAPEQIKETANVDHRADIYSLGVVFYEMLTGDLPIGRFPAPSESVQINVNMDKIVLKALEKDPERRYQHASQIREDITRTSSGKEPLGEAVFFSNKDAYMGLLSIVCLFLGFTLIVEIFDEMVYLPYTTYRIENFFQTEIYQYLYWPLGWIAMLVFTATGLNSLKTKSQNLQMKWKVIAVLQGLFFPLVIVNLLGFIVLPNYFNLGQFGQVFIIVCVVGLAALIAEILLLKPLFKAMMKCSDFKGKFYKSLVTILIILQIAGLKIACYIAEQKKDARLAFVQLNSNLRQISSGKILLNQLDKDGNIDPRRQYIFTNNDSVGKVEKLLHSPFGPLFLEALADYYNLFGYDKSSERAVLILSEGDSFKGVFFSKNGVGSNIGFPSQVIIEKVKCIDGQLEILYNFPSKYSPYPFYEDDELKEYNEKYKKEKEEFDFIKKTFKIEPNKSYKLNITLDEAFSSNNVDWLLIWRNGKLQE